MVENDLKTVYTVMLKKRSVAAGYGTNMEFIERF